MKKNLYTISKKDLFDLFSRLASASRVVVPYIKGDKFYFDDFDAEKEEYVELGGIRQSVPVKSFFSQAREKVSGQGEDKSRPLILAGVKSCDLAGFHIQDSVFLKCDTPDPIFAANREKTTIISVDCTSAKETCFCLAMEGTPYPTVNFDMNLSDMDLIEVNEAFAVQVLSNQRILNWDSSKLNVHGGAIALGHPTGISGARILVTGYYALKRLNKTYCVASICGGGGVSTAIVFKRES